MNKELIQVYYATCCDHSAFIVLILLTCYLISLSSNIPSNYSTGPSCPMIQCSTTCHTSLSSFIYLNKTKAVSQSAQKESANWLSQKRMLTYFLTNLLSMNHHHMLNEAVSSTNKQR